MSNRYSKNPSNLKSTDLYLSVKGVPFHLHKETLAKRSARLTTVLERNKLDELRSILRDTDIDPITFHLVTRFCYGYKIQLSSENIVSVLCIAYYLEMSDDHSSDNLLNKAVTFLEQRVLISWNETVKALRSCSNKILDKLADVGLIEVFLDSLVEKALNDARLLQDLITLPLRLYEPLILETSKHNVSKENLVESVCNYAKRWIFEKDSGDENVSRHKREVIEAVERLFPHERGTISCGFLFKSLKESILLDACSDCRKGFVRISKQLDLATAKDLMILSKKEDGSYDIELLKTILKNFYSNYSVSDFSRFVSVARMLEEFLFETAASHASLRVETFKELAEIVVAASCDVLKYSDGIYSAIDVFLERHRDLIESEKMEACRVLECKKLSPEACEHASKNEKLPLRIVVQVFFVCQMHIRDKVAREMKGVEEKTENRVDEEDEEDDEMENMSKKLLSLKIKSDYSKKRKIENLECAVHSGEKKMKEKKISAWGEVKRKFGCMTSSSVDALDCHIKKRKKTYHRYK
ncbi:BTB/POZ domain-containing protein [Cardamine amara subsp. amara]|uniref:BTB/POZ domain-containing protein n=1 Tax=Cardamine amara subsp. amara TaxID=228776 RepID=A0ABD1AYA3_CARAN